MKNFVMIRAYITCMKMMPKWTTCITDLGELLKKRDGSDIKRLPSFSFYRDESLSIQYNVYHPIDYIDHDVKIIVGEFDSNEHFEKNKIVNSVSLRKIRGDGLFSTLKAFHPPLENKEFVEDKYTREFFELLSKDPRILFCYITTSGKGIRFAFKVDENINNDIEYISNYYYYSKKFLEDDIENQFGLEFVCDIKGSLYNLTNIASVYWLLPISDYIYYNSDSEAVKKI
jgi:hypothetical protein